MKFYIVDVFAEKKYQGNQLAVFIQDNEIPTEEMQQIAHEINYSETSFIMPDKQNNGGYNVRYFTPDTEIPFAGHPTLGTAYIIHQKLENGKTDKIILNLEVGQIPVTINSDILIMEQKEPEFGLLIENLETAANLLRISKDDIMDSIPVQIVSTGLPCMVIPLKTMDALKRCAVNHDRYQEFIDDVYKCNLLAFYSEAGNTVRVRVFVDDPGFVEDAATGSANGNLAGYLLKYNFFGERKIEYSALQGHEMNRPSLLLVNAELENNAYKIQVGGKVQPIAEGIWL